MVVGYDALGVNATIRNFSLFGKVSPLADKGGGAGMCVCGVDFQVTNKTKQKTKNE